MCLKNMEIYGKQVKHMIRLQETRWVTTFKTMFKFDVFFCSDVNFQDFRDVQVVRLHHPINSRFSGT